MPIRSTEPHRTPETHSQGLRQFARHSIVVAVVCTGAILAATEAQAQPAGCTRNTISLTASAAGALTASTSAICNTTANRTIVAEVKWDKAWAPDPLTAKNSRNLTGTNYSVSVTTCDGGNTRGYYGRGYFTSNTTYYDTSPRDITTCS
jgi:hypothetical protein